MRKEHHFHHQFHHSSPKSRRDARPDDDVIRRFYYYHLTLIQKKDSSLERLSLYRCLIKKKAAKGRADRARNEEAFSSATLPALSVSSVHTEKHSAWGGLLLFSSRCCLSFCSCLLAWLFLLFEQEQQRDVEHYLCCH